jgi:hypothetical protein
MPQISWQIGLFRLGEKLGMERFASRQKTPSRTIVTQAA